MVDSKKHAKRKLMSDYVQAGIVVATLLLGVPSAVQAITQLLDGPTEVRLVDTKGVEATVEVSAKRSAFTAPEGSPVNIEGLDGLSILQAASRNGSSLTPTLRATTACDQYAKILVHNRGKNPVNNFRIKFAKVGIAQQRDMDTEYETTFFLQDGVLTVFLEKQLNQDQKYEFQIWYPSSELYDTDHFTVLADNVNKPVYFSNEKNLEGKADWGWFLQIVLSVGLSLVLFAAFYTWKMRRIGSVLSQQSWEEAIR